VHGEGVSSLTIYTLQNCSTCRQAVKWLDAHGIAYREKPIRETPPSLAELRAMLAAQEGELRRLFNTSGLEYRAHGLAQKLPRLKTVEALQLLAGNGSLVKRPFLIGPEVALLGFDADAWKASLTL
jgi:arsenate reductase